MSTDKPQPRVHDDPECKCAECVALDGRIDVALGQMRVGLRRRARFRAAQQDAERRTGRDPYQDIPRTATGLSAPRKDGN